MAGDRRLVVGEAPAGAQPAQSSRTISAPTSSWPRKPTQPSRSVRVTGLPMSCRSAAKRIPSRRVSSSASGSASAAATSSAAVAGVVVEVGLDLEPAAQHLDRVRVDVEVVVGALADPAQRLELAAAPPGWRRAGRAARARAAGRARRASPRSSAKRRSPAGSAARGAAARGRAATVSRVRLEAERGARAARRASGAAGRRRRSVGEADREPARGEVGEATEWVDRLAAAERHRDRVDGEVAQAQVGLDRRPRAARRCRRPGSRSRRHAPGLELARELEGVAAEQRRRSAGAARATGPSTARSTSVIGRPASASRTAPPTIQIPPWPRPRPARSADPCSEAASRGLDRARRALTGAAACGTRGEIPQVIS